MRAVREMHLCARTLVQWSVSSFFPIFSNTSGHILYARSETTETRVVNSKPSSHPRMFGRRPLVRSSISSFMSKSRYRSRMTTVTSVKARDSINIESELFLVLSSHVGTYIHLFRDLSLSSQGAKATFRGNERAGKERREERDRSREAKRRKAWSGRARGWK